MTEQKIPLTWQNIRFTVTVKPNYFVHARMAHVEIHCERPLPMTSTGYRSMFIPQGELPETDKLCAEILQNMSDTARETGWTRHEQMSLF